MGEYFGTTHPISNIFCFSRSHRKTSVFPVSAVEDLQAKHSIEEQIETARDLLGAVSAAGVVQLENDAPAQRWDADHGLHGECRLGKKRDNQRTKYRTSSPASATMSF